MAQVRGGVGQGPSYEPESELEGNAMGESYAKCHKAVLSVTSFAHLGWKSKFLSRRSTNNNSAIPLMMFCLLLKSTKS